ncbi:MAG: Mov34/MPN/PAD-1 family protein [Acidimicrobiales bacterium]
MHVPILILEDRHRQMMVDHARRDLPNEACGLLAGEAESATVLAVYPCSNAEASPIIYTLDPRDHLRATRDAEGRGWEILGVYHSHTHTEAYPSPTDVARAPDPGWHYVLVSLRDSEPVVRSFRIVDEVITEEAIEVGPPAGGEAGPDQS